jgi:hypothetical protein
MTLLHGMLTLASREPFGAACFAQLSLIVQAFCAKGHCTVGTRTNSSASLAQGYQHKQAEVALSPQFLHSCRIEGAKGAHGANDDRAEAEGEHRKMICQWLSKGRSRVPETLMHSVMPASATAKAGLKTCSQLPL